MMKQTEQTGEVFCMGFAASDQADVQKAGRRSNRSGTGTSSTLPQALSEQESITLPTNPADQQAILIGIVANLRSGFILFDSAEAVAYANSSAQRLLGLEHARTGSHSPAFDMRKQLVTLAANPTTAGVELDRLWKDPETESFVDLALADAAIRWLRIHCFPVRAQLGQLLGRGVLLDDITLERSAIQSRNETLAMAAHELKTPLAIIKGSATTLLSGSSRWDPAMQREMLQMIDTQTDRLHELLNTLLEVWRLDAGAQNLRLNEVYIPTLFHLLIERWHKNAPRHRFVCDIVDEIPPIFCDPMRLEQALHQLLHNAVTNSPDGGTIRLSVEGNEGELRLCISDQGRGIDPELLDQIFDRFYRVAEDNELAHQGSGLGLTVVRAIVEAHGGHIWADSDGIGKGARFFLTLPITPPNIQGTSFPWQTGRVSPGTGSASIPTPPVRHNQRPRIAVVESDKRIARYLRAHLEEQHYRVQVIQQGTQLLRQFDLEEPDLILLATHLVDIQGIELLQRLREFSRVPVIMLCAEDDEDKRVNLLDLGADDLVNKPFGIKELLARLRVHLRRQARQSEGQTSESIFT
ncbi:MAG TPA: ATP-binding protein, partial [Ktedonobacteraceae bacterium]|nr:ATP-binding protein [Ktedonobacteraceae bacterium]